MPTPRASCWLDCHISDEPATVTPTSPTAKPIQVRTIRRLRSEGNLIMGLPDNIWSREKSPRTQENLARNLKEYWLTSA